MKKYSTFTLALALILSVLPFGQRLHAQAPTWQWAHTAGSSAEDYSGGLDYNSSTISTDLNGNSYITGLFNGTANFGNSISLSSPLHPEVFVAKYDAYGNCLWAKQFGGNDGDIYGNEGKSVDVDAQGNCYVTGTFHGQAGDLIPFGSSTLIATGQRQIFVVKYDASGNEQWAQNPTSNTQPNNYGKSIAADPAGSTYITGYLGGGGNTFGSTSPMYGPGAYVVKHDASGTALWASKICTNGAADGISIACDKEGNSYVTGYMQGTEIFPTSPTSTITSYGSRDVFVAKIDATGALAWVTHFGNAAPPDSVGPGNQAMAYGKGISVDGLGNIFVTGDFDSQLAFGTTTLTSNNTEASFIVKLDNTGSPLWALQSISSGGPAGGGTYGTAVKANSTGNCYITGYYYPSGFGSESLAGILFPNTGNQITYAIKIDSTGAAAWAVFTQGSSCISAGISLDGAGNVYVAGNNQGTNLFGSNSITSYGNYDAFIAKVCSGSACATTNTNVATGIKTQNLENALAIYPNPFSMFATLDTRAYTGSDPLELKIYDLLGREVKTLSNISGPSNLLSREGLSNGVYTYKLWNKSSLLQTGKLMLE